MVKSPVPLIRDPRRRPRDWRWRLGVHLGDHPDDAEAQALADLWVAMVLVLLRDLRRDPTAVPPSPLLIACGIHQVGDPRRRWVVEAHLLTGVPLEQAAQRSGVGRDVLGAYRQVFFDVGDPRQAAGDMLQELVGAKLCLGLSEDDQRALLILAADRGAGDLVSGLDRHFRGAPLTTKDFAVSDPTALDDLRERLRVKLWLVRRTMPLNELMELSVNILEEVERLIASPTGRKRVSLKTLAAPAEGERVARRVAGVRRGGGETVASESASVTRRRRPCALPRDALHWSMKRRTGPEVALMGWERRGTRMVYYRAKKIAGRVVREYFGRGERAELAALQDASRRAEREKTARAWRAEQSRFTVVDGAVDRLALAVQAVVRASLLLRGYKRHARGHWRRTRGS